MKARVTKDTITPALKNLSRVLRDKSNVYFVGTAAKSIITNRTLLGTSPSGATFPAYSQKEYRAPIDNRPPGYPKPKGGRKKSLKGKRDLKAMVFKSYAAYKAGIGRGSKPQLSVSNKMLMDIQVAASGRTATLFWADRLSAAKAHGHHHGGRPFFDINERDPRELNTMMKALVRRMRKLAAVRSATVKRR